MSKHSLGVPLSLNNQLTSSLKKTGSTLSKKLRFNAETSFGEDINATTAKKDPKITIIGSSSEKKEETALQEIKMF